MEGKELFVKMNEFVLSQNNNDLPCLKLSLKVMKFNL